MTLAMAKRLVLDDWQKINNNYDNKFHSYSTYVIYIPIYLCMNIAAIYLGKWANLSYGALCTVCRHCLLDKLQTCIFIVYLYLYLTQLPGSARVLNIFLSWNQHHAFHFYIFSREMGKIRSHGIWRGSL